MKIYLRSASKTTAVTINAIGSYDSECCEACKHAYPKNEMHVAHPCQEVAERQVGLFTLDMPMRVIRCMKYEQTSESFNRDNPEPKPIPTVLQPESVQRIKELLAGMFGDDAKDQILQLLNPNP